MLPGFFIGLILVGISYHVPGTMGQEGVYLTGLIIYEIFFGSYACLTWVRTNQWKAPPRSKTCADPHLPCSVGHTCRSLSDLPAFVRHDDE